MEHSRIGFSSLGRWGRCPGSIKLTEHLPKTTSVYAEEGHAAHELAEKCLLSGLNTSGFVGKIGDFEITDEMRVSVQAYLDFVRSKINNMKLLVEQKFNVAWVDSDLWGTNDACILEIFEELHVFDYKHGKHVFVPIKEPTSNATTEFDKKTVEIFGCLPNPQLLGYACGAVGEKNPYGVYDISIHVCQPRCESSEGPNGSFSFNIKQLKQWEKEVLAPAAKRVRDGSNKLCVGPWCDKHFCAAKGVCPAKEKITMEVAKVDFDNVKPNLVDSAVGLSNERIGKIIENIGAMRNFLTAVERVAFNKAEKGEVIPGCKLVKKTTHRRWKENPNLREDLANVLLSKTFLNPETIKTPAQVEKAAKEAGVNISYLIEKPIGGNKLVSNASKGVPVSPSIEADFVNL